MSIESATQFLEAVKTDKAFADRLAQTASIEERTRIVKDAGYSFTAAELSEVKGELTTEELDAVAGGCWDSPCNYTKE